MDTNEHQFGRPMPGELMIGYLTLSAEERAEFDRYYAKREVMIEVRDLLKMAKPEQLERVRELTASVRSNAATQRREQG